MSKPKIYIDGKEGTTGLQIYEGFGQTEGPVLLATFPWIEPRPGSMGKPSPLLNIKLLDEEGIEVPDGEEGAICVTGLKEAYPPGLFVGYYGNPERTVEAVGGEYYNLHDMAWRDSDGYYVVAAGDMAQGSTFTGSKGDCKVYDSGCAAGTTDYYTGW